MHKPLRYEGNTLVTSAAACPVGGGEQRVIPGKSPVGILIVQAGKWGFPSRSREGGGGGLE